MSPKIVDKEREDSHSCRCSPLASSARDIRKFWFRWFDGASLHLIELIS